MNEKKTILEYIEEALPRRDSCFVFPSAVPAQFWARKAAEHSLTAIASDRFIAWDTFKEKTLSLGHPKKDPVNDAVRTIVASKLIKENQRASEKGSPILKEILNPRFPGAASSFVPSIAQLLPCLETLLRRGDASVFRGDAYFEDLLVLHAYYSAFLGEHDFYEPSWNRAPFNGRGMKWLLFFPELAEDWGEYAEELGREEVSGEITIIPLERIAPPDRVLLSPEKKRLLEEILGIPGGGIARFSASPEEYLWLALKIRRLLNEGGLSLSDIAVTMPGLGDNAERLELELKLRDIPADIRGGKSPAEHPGGRIFALLASCEESNWSYEALKNLLLDRAYPWKDPETIGMFLEFGLEYRCVSGFTEEGKAVDVWERSFSRTWEQSGAVRFPVTRLRDWYRHLKKDIQAILRAESFFRLRGAWHHFRDTHLEERAAFHPEIDKVLSRTMDALDELIEIEEKLPEPAGLDPFSVFRSYLGGKNYVFQPEGGGIPVYEYRVAAGIAPAVHFIINMNQEDATVRTSPVPFLREDRKQSAKLPDQDLSALFIRAYGLSAALPLFSVPDRTFRGPSLPHHMLREIAGGREAFVPVLAGEDDPLRAEEMLIRGRPVPNCPAASEMQRAGRRAYEHISAKPLPRDIRSNSVSQPELISALAGALSRKGEDRRISPTDLTEYIRCPFAWLLQRGLGIREKQTEIETIDQRDLGMLYHRILERLFSRIREEDRRFRADRIAYYKDFLREEVHASLEEERSREGAFQESIYEMIAGRIYAALEAYLENDLAVLEGAEISGTEFPLRLEYSSAGMALSGKADLVLLDRESGYILTDFKTSSLPPKGDLVLSDEGDTVPANLQMAAYIRMLENGSSHGVRNARFYSLEKQECCQLIADGEAAGASSRSRLPVSREEYEGEVRGVDLAFSNLVSDMREGNYRVPRPSRRSSCSECPVNSVCRITFSGGETHE